MREAGRAREGAPVMAAEGPGGRPIELLKVLHELGMNTTPTALQTWTRPPKGWAYHLPSEKVLTVTGANTDEPP